VLDEHLVRDAGRARDELDTLAQVISANLTRAALEAAPVIADLSSWLADVAGKASIAWERLFDTPEEKSLRTLRYELDLTENTIAKLEARIRELQESPTRGFTTFLDTAQISALERKLDKLRRARDQTHARIAFLEGPPDTGASAPTSAPGPDDTAGVQDRAKNLERIARELEGTLFSITHEGSERIIAEHERRVAEIEALRTQDRSNAQQVDRLIAQSAAVRDAQLSQLRAKEGEAAEKARAANERVVASLEAEREALAQTERHQHRSCQRAGAGLAPEHHAIQEQHAVLIFQRPAVECGDGGIELPGHSAHRGRADRPAEHRQERGGHLAGREPENEARQDHAIDAIRPPGIDPHHLERAEGPGARYVQLDHAELGERPARVPAVAPVGLAEFGHAFEVLVDQLAQSGLPAARQAPAGRRRDNPRPIPRPRPASPSSSQRQPISS
jgi:hypothetical protein